MGSDAVVLDISFPPLISSGNAVLGKLYLPEPVHDSAF